VPLGKKENMAADAARETSSLLEVADLPPVLQENAGGRSMRI
jgi:hypothetical protein